MKTRGIGSGLTIVLVAVGLLVVLAMGYVGSYNTLVAKDTTVEQRAANIESQLKRRADLVPNLVATVKGYAKHESEIFKDIADARARLLRVDVSNNPQEAAAVSQQFNSALGRLLAIAENYPTLKADQNFIRLQDELAGTENRINYARIEYNEAVRDYNTTVRSFPTNIVAGMAGFEKKASFQATEAERATPQVQF